MQEGAVHRSHSCLRADKKARSNMLAPDFAKRFISIVGIFAARRNIVRDEFANHEP